MVKSLFIRILYSGVLMLLLCPWLAVAQTRTTLNLNKDWNFTPGYEVRKNVSTRVNLPHTWNQDALSGKVDYFRGLGNYQKKVMIDSSLVGNRLFLRFKGANQIANVFINGKHVGEHRGGYTSFTFEITDFVKFGVKNDIWVRVNNAPQLDVMPLVGDFNFYGGLYRDVDLIITGKSCISPLFFGSSGMLISQKNVTKLKADLEISLHLSLNSDDAKVITEIYDAAGIKVQSIAKPVEREEARNPIKISTTIEKPHLWNGRKDPYLYLVKSSLWVNQKLADVQTQPLGVRFFRIDPDSGFFLNGEHLQLKGVCRHQDRSEVGNALQPAHHEEDVRIMLEMGVNAVRLSHYPQDQYVYDLMDRNGIVVWSEIPFVGPGGYRDKGFVDQLSFMENGKQQLQEMIFQQQNHPSIFMWGLFNELKYEGDDPQQYIKELNKFAHSIDSTRLTTAASNLGGSINRLTDLIAWNMYLGWYGGNPAEIGEWADLTHKEYAGTPIGISEYGAGASIYHQQEKLNKPEANSYWHPENWQAYFHEEHWKAISSRPYLWGTFVWNMFDFGAAHRTEGDMAGKNDKGLVTFDRKYKKDAFYFYKANWNLDEPFVYIAEKRLVKRSILPQVIKVYSNEKEVELFINGKSLGKRSGHFGTFIWEQVDFPSNVVTLRAVSRKYYDEVRLVKEGSPSL